MQCDIRILFRYDISTITRYRYIGIKKHSHYMSVLLESIDLCIKYVNALLESIGLFSCMFFIAANKLIFQYLSKQSTIVSISKFDTIS